MSTTASASSGKTKHYNVDAVNEFLKAKSKDTSKYNIQSIIRQLKISQSMSTKEIKQRLSKYILEDKFNQLLANSVITKYGDEFILGDFKGTKQQILMNLLSMKENTDAITKMINELHQSVISNYQFIQNEMKINTNKQSILMLKSENKTLMNQRSKLVESVHKQNRQLIDAVYKQGRIESGMRTQQSLIQFQKDNLGVKFQRMKQNFESQIIKNQSIRIMRDSQIHANNLYRTTNRHHMSRMNQLTLITELNNDDQKQKIDLLRKKNELLQKLLNENKDLRKDLNKGVLNLVDILNRNGIDIRKATQQQAERINKALEQAAERVKNATEGARDAIKAAFNNAARELGKTIDQFGKLQDRHLDDIISTLDGIGKKDKDLDDILDKPRPPPELPMSCKDPPCFAQHPGSHWILNIQNAKLKDPQDGLDGFPITIWRCSNGAHYCSSNNQHGKWTGDDGRWDDVKHIFSY